MKKALLVGCYSFVGFLILDSAQNASADVIQHFDTVAGTSSGEFGWDDFTGTYAGPHAPDRFSTGVGAGTVTVTPGGILTTTNNLYSFNTIATWSHNLTGLKATDANTSIALQFATSATLNSSLFTLGGAAPTEFLDLGQRSSAGGFGTNYYWAEWQGLTAAPNYTIAVAGTGIHQVLGGAKVTYFNNSSSAYNITAVPEPSSGISLAALIGSAFLRRRRKAC